MTTTKSQIKLNNQSAIVRAQYKIYNIAIFLAQIILYRMTKTKTLLHPKHNDNSRITN